MPLRQASRAVTRIYDEALRPSGLLATQLSVLIVLAHFGESGAPVSALADAIVADRTTLTRNLRPLQNGKLIAIGRSSEDGRTRVVRLTRAGAHAIERAFPLWRLAQQRVAEVVGRERILAVRDSVRGLARNLMNAG